MSRMVHRYRYGLNEQGRGFVAGDNQACLFPGWVCADGGSWFLQMDDRRQANYLQQDFMIHTDSLTAPRLKPSSLGRGVLFSDR